MPSCGCRPAAPPQRPPLTSSSRWFYLAAVSLPQRPGQQHLPDGSLPQCRNPLRHGTSGHQLCHGAPSSSSPRCPGQQYLCHCGALASNIFPIALCHSAAILFAMALPAISSASAPRPAISSATAPRLSAPPRHPRQHLPDGSSLQRPCQQQTSSGREELRFG